MANSNPQQLNFTRSLIQSVNRNKIPFVYDFPYGEYRAQRNFFDELSRVQSQLIDNGKVRLGTGQEADLTSTGGLLALQIYMETVDSTKEAMIGLSKTGQKNDNKLWTLQ